MRPFLTVTLAYLLGSIPFGYLIVRAKEGTDIRKSGSHGTGATNVSRRAGKLAGVLTLLLDVSKGFLAVLLAYKLLQVGTEADESGRWLAIAAVAVVIGHIFPLWLKFQGGKGVATGIGVSLFLFPWSMFIAAAVFLAVVLMTRYVSLASILSTLTVPVTTFWLGSGPGFSDKAATVAASCIAILIVFAHRANIQRLLRGTENKFW